MNLLQVLEAWEQISESTIEIDYVPLTVHENSNHAGVLRLIQKSKANLIRGLLDLNNGGTVLWDAMLATHDDVAMEMGISDYTEFMVGPNNGGPEKVNAIASDSIMRRAFVGPNLVVYARSIRSLDQFPAIARLMAGEENITTVRVHS